MLAPGGEAPRLLTADCYECPQHSNLDPQHAHCMACRAYPFFALPSWSLLLLDGLLAVLENAGYSAAKGFVC
jgi:hypothetical protein